MSRESAHRSLKVEAWPATDQQAWQAAIREGDILEPGGIASNWAVLTRREVGRGYGFWLAWLERNGLLDHTTQLADRVTPERAAQYIADLNARCAPYTVVVRIHQLHAALRAMAADRDWQWLLRSKQRLIRRAASVRNKRARVVATDRLLELGYELMSTADAGSERPNVGRAAHYRDGLMIALLALRPFRIHNFASITIGEHLAKRGDGYWLRFEAEETKNRKPIEVPFPAALLPQLERYLIHYRPVLATDVDRRKHRKRAAHPPTMALWVSRDRTPMREEAVYYHVVTLTREKLGHAINPHLFRDCAATTIATDDPQHVYITHNILGHTSLSTSERFYNQAKSMNAYRTYQIEVQRRRSAQHDGGVT
jgi:integrase/recombinase XerD